ncbi:MAG: hypothetical protein ACK5LY_04000, partial [Lachnospirales bacterium]
NIENGLPIINEFGILQLKYENGFISKISEIEIQEELENLPKAEPTEVEVLKEDSLMLMETTTELYEKTLALEQQNLDLMVAITEIYEMNL